MIETYRQIHRRTDRQPHSDIHRQAGSVICRKKNNKEDKDDDIDDKKAKTEIDN